MTNILAIAVETIVQVPTGQIILTMDTVAVLIPVTKVTVGVRLPDVTTTTMAIAIATNRRTTDDLATTMAGPTITPHEVIVALMTANIAPMTANIAIMITNMITITHTLIDPMIEQTQQNHFAGVATFPTHMVNTPTVM